MQCVKCKYEKARLVKILQDDNYNTTRRRRECLRCGHRFTTEETMIQPKQMFDEKYQRDRAK